MTMVRMNNIISDFFNNMDEIAMDFGRHFNYSLWAVVAKKLSVRHGCSGKCKCIVCIAGAADGTKMPLEVVLRLVRMDRLRTV